MRHRPRLLDLFCGAGGAGAGYHAAGFDVIGVDIAPQPDYPFPFLRADALSVDLRGFHVVHASPPCQLYSVATPPERREQHPDLIAPMRRRLAEAARLPGGPLVWVMENVPGAPLDNPVTICGDSLRLGVRRHRLFESNRPLVGTRCWHDRPTPTIGVYGSYGQRTGRKPVDGETSPSTEQARAAMGIDWMPWPALTQAIPPAYTYWLGVQIITSHLRGGGDVIPRPGDYVTGSAGQPSPATVLRDAIRRRQSSAGDTTAQDRCVTTDSGDATTPAGIRHCRNPQCGKPLYARPATGRWPRYCSHACRQAAYRARKEEAA